MFMAYHNPYQYLDYSPADDQFWTYKKVSFVASLILIFLLMTFSFRPRNFLLISMVATSLTMLFDYEGAVMGYFVRLIKIVAFVLLFRFSTWVAKKVKGHRSRSDGEEDEDENEDDERISAHVSLGLIAIVALVLTWCVQKLQRPRRRRGL